MTDPYRVSSLSNLARCAGLFDLRRAQTTRTESRPANSGSASGRAIELWHESGGQGISEHVARVMGSELASWPYADPDDVSAWATGYARDPRNQTAIVSHCEAEVRLELPPAPEDPTGEPILLVGHIDQLRDEGDGGGPKVWDVKTSKGGGHGLTLEYAWQLAAYTLACQDTIDPAIQCGGIIRLRDYSGRSSEPRVFYPTPWTTEHCWTMMGTVAWLIASLRSGVIPLLPGSHCQWCPAEHPHLCAQLLEGLPQ